ncbi:hypothetical protein B4U80_14449, partial [Leptotrombidium deliense]
NLPKVDDPLENGVIQLTSAWRAYFDEAALRRMKIALKQYFAAIIMEKRSKRRATCVLEYEYDIFRYYTIGGAIFFEVTLSLADVKIPCHFESSQCFALLHESMVKIFILLNDVCSFENDIKENNKVNYICIIKEAKGYETWQEAIDEVVCKINDEFKTFQMAEKLAATEAINHEETEAAARAIDLLKREIFTFFLYMTTSKRYNYKRKFIIEWN